MGVLQCPLGCCGDKLAERSPGFRLINIFGELGGRPLMSKISGASLKSH